MSDKLSLSTLLAPLDQSNPETRWCGTISTYRWKCLKNSEWLSVMLLSTTGQQAKKRGYDRWYNAHTSLVVMSDGRLNKKRRWAAAWLNVVQTSTRERPRKEVLSTKRSRASCAASLCKPLHQSKYRDQLQ